MFISTSTYRIFKLIFIMIMCYQSKHVELLTRMLSYLFYGFMAGNTHCISATHHYATQNTQGERPCVSHPYRNGNSSELLYRTGDGIFILKIPNRSIFFKILLDQPEIRLYLPISDWFGTKRTSVWFQIIRKMVNTIWFWVDLIRFGKYFSVCNLESAGEWYGHGLY